MAEWKAESRGGVTGYKIFHYILKNYGPQKAYIVLRFVALYFVFFSPKAFRAVLNYFTVLHGQSFFTALVNIYRNYYVFGQTILDRFAVLMGQKHYFTFDFDGRNLLDKMREEKKGGILISAHVGNFEVAGTTLAHLDCNIYLVTTTVEHDKLMEYVDSMIDNTWIRFIVVKEDMSHIFEISKALKNNDLICFTGDRFFEGGKTLSAKLLGKEARFPAGPFSLATRFQVPTAFLFGMKETNTHYYFRARIAKERKDAQTLLKEYCSHVEEMLAKYPLQWFNYFDFWELDKAQIPK